MPEGPEAAYISSFINKEFVNKTLNKVNILKGRYINHGPPKNYNNFVSALPLKLLNVEKKGKVIFIYFDNDWYIISKLGMSGWWYSNNKPAWRSEFKSVVFEFNNTNDALIYSDPRSYGTLTFTQDTNLIHDELEQLAPDIISKRTTVKVFLSKAQLITIKKPHMPLEELLADQKLLISGIGNYLKSEIMYTCKIAPMRKLVNISDEEWKNIYKNAKKISNYMSKALASKKIDAYESKMNVYNKKQDPRGNTIETYKNKNGRTVHWVPQIQK